MYNKTYQTGIIGNCAFMGHVKTNTNISWLCWPRFDSSFVFGGLLDNEAGGEFSILPSGEKEYSSNQYYIENTNVLRTEITSVDGTYRVTDFAPRFRQFDRYFKPLMLIRKIEPISGSPKITVRCNPTYDYGRLKLTIHRGSNHLVFQGGPEPIRLTTDIALSNFVEEKSFVLTEAKYIFLTYGIPLEAPIVSTAEHFLRETINYWRKWIKHSTI